MFSKPGGAVMRGPQRIGEPLPPSQARTLGATMVKWGRAVFGRSGPAWAPFRAVRYVIYLSRHGEDDMVGVFGRNPNGGDVEALRLGAASVAGGASPVSS